ncbi:MAG TPA: hypothetical protein VGX00_05225 [Thermoplasmata archaeon]|nr:hypothetical protein [Thermoplasmata archaeon]
MEAKYCIDCDDDEVRIPTYLSDSPWNPKFSLIEFSQKGHSICLGVLDAMVADAISDVPALVDRPDWGEFSRELVSGSIAEWQRPLDTSRMTEIGQFWSADDNFIVNPVVLAIKEDWASPKLRFSVKEGEVIPHAPFKLVTMDFESWYVQQCPKCGHRDDGKWFDRCLAHGCHHQVARPIVVIDGQHRIRGSQQGPAPGATISSTGLKANREPLPVSLIRSDRPLIDFTQSQQAKIFTEITTKSVELEAAHKLYLLWKHHLKGEVEIWGGG